MSFLVSLRSRSIRSLTPPSDILFDESIFAEENFDDDSRNHSITSLSYVDKCLPKGHQHLKASAITRVAIKKLVSERVATALEAQAVMMAIINNPNKNFRPRKTHVARKCTHENFMNCQPFYFNGTEGAVGLIHWFEQTESIFSHSNCAKKNKVKFAINTLTVKALFWQNSIAQSIGVEEAYKIT
ncbi:hypothetical protein Tco_0883460 [Tanacetum coccineum]